MIAFARLLGAWRDRRAGGATGSSYAAGSAACEFSGSASAARNNLLEQHQARDIRARPKPLKPRPARHRRSRRSLLASVSPAVWKRRTPALAAWRPIFAEQKRGEALCPGPGVGDRDGELG